MIVISISAYAQQPPGSEIFLFDLKKKGQALVLENPQNITNHPGYDNQPFFHPKRSIVYFVSADSAGRTDIYGYDFKRGKTSRITTTHDKEYSPTVTPDQRWLSCILQNDKGEQHLVKYPIEGGEPITLIDNLIVGYHAWLDDDRVALFVLAQPIKLIVRNVNSGKDTVITENIGRSLQHIQDEHRVSFIKKDEDGSNVFTLDRSLLTTKLTSTVDKLDHDMAWTPGGKILMSSDQKIFWLLDDGWHEVEIKSTAPIFKITRMAVSPDGKKIAIVMSE